MVALQSTFEPGDSFAKVQGGIPSYPTDCQESVLHSTNGEAVPQERRVYPSERSYA